MNIQKSRAEAVHNKFSVRRKKVGRVADGRARISADTISRMQRASKIFPNHWMIL